MITAIRSDHASFKKVLLDRGFNVILAERKEESSSKDSRNGVGKTTLIEIILFCLGSTPDIGIGLRVKELDDWTFFVDLTLRGRNYTVSRNTKNVSTIG